MADAALVGAEPEAPPSAFVELTGTQILGASPATGTVVEVADKGGTRLAVRAAALAPSREWPLMDGLAEWLRAEIAERKVEPNSGLGEAIGYTEKHWSKLTLFLRVSSAPLDNNISERALTKAILHRKNALFDKTQSGAHAHRKSTGAARLTTAAPLLMTVFCLSPLVPRPPLSIVPTRAVAPGHSRSSATGSTRLFRL